MINDDFLVILVNILQFFATIMVASEYYIKKRDTILINKFYRKIFNDYKVKDKIKLDIIRLKHEKELKINILHFSIILLVTIIILFFPIFSNYLFKKIQISQSSMLIIIIISMILLAIFTSLLAKYYIKLMRIYVDNFWYSIIIKMGKLILLSKKNYIVGMGIILFSFSFLCNIWIKLGLNNSVLFAILWIIFLAITMHISFLVQAYKIVK